MRSTAAKYGGVKAFSSEVDPGSREENASKQKDRAPFRFNRNGNGSRERLEAQMTRAQAMRLKSLSEEAYQPGQYARGLTGEEAERRIHALEAEIALADSF